MPEFTIPPSGKKFVPEGDKPRVSVNLLEKQVLFESQCKQYRDEDKWRVGQHEAKCRWCLNCVPFTSPKREARK